MLRPHLSAREATLEIESIYPGLRGVDLRIAHYSEAGFSVESLHVKLPWVGLFGGLESLQLHVDCSRIFIDIDALPHSNELKPATAEDLVAGLPGHLGGLFESISSAVLELSLGALSASVGEIQLTASERTVSCSSELSVMVGESNATVLTGRVSNENFNIDARLRVDETGRELGLDFVASAANWEAFAKVFFPEIGPDLKEKQVDLYFDPLEGSGSFTDISGYARWSADKPDRVRAAVLGNLGAIEVFTRSGGFRSHSASFGLATDGLALCRAYLSLPIDTVQVGSWQANEGEVVLRLDGSTASTRVKLGEDSFTLKYPSVLDLIEQSGEIYFTAELKQFGESLVNAVAPRILPLDVTFQASLNIDGQVELSKGALVDPSGKAEWAMSELQWPEKSLSISDFSGAAQLDSLIDGVPVGQSDLRIDTLNLAEVIFSGIETRIELTDTGIATVDDFSARILGGAVNTDSFNLNLDTKSSSPIRLRLENIDLATLAAAVPQFDGVLAGAASGDIHLELTNSDLRLKDGFLGLDEAVPARLSYSMHGMLTQGLSPESASYRQYHMAELALENLTLKRFKIEFFPEGDESKPIYVTFYGESKQEGTLVPIDYTLNVNTDDSADLIQLLQIMQSGQLDIQ
jgi:hypothetical protein